MTLRRKRSGRRSQKDSAVRINHNYGRFTEMNNIRSADAKVICRKEFKYLALSMSLGKRGKVYGTYYTISNQAAKLHGLGNVGQLRFHRPRHSIEDAHPSMPITKYINKISFVLIKK